MSGRICFVLILFLLSITCSESLVRRKRIVGGTAAAQPPEDDPVVFVNKNDRSARIYGSRDPDKGFYVFRGIRFGHPPTGRYRFQRPEPVHLEGEFNATEWASPCSQPSQDGSGRVIGSEDCLFLNIFTPILPDSGDGYPVLIWIHGGGFKRGAACQYEMRNLIKKKLVVVSIQYRLGSLGFLSTGTRELPGNNGMFDMVLAINWVKDYIEFFGGNPKNIVAFGHGTGASSALMLSLSKLSQNFLSGVIAMSGSILSHFAVDRHPLSTAKTIAKSNECPTENVTEMIQCLKEIPVEKLVRTDSIFEMIRTASQGFISGLSNLLSAGPVIDGSDDERSLPGFLTDTPENFLKFENFPAIPLLTGVVKDETGGAIFGDYRSEIEEKLKTVPNFFDRYLIPTLQENVPNLFNTTQMVPQIFKNYFSIFKNGGSDNDIDKVSEAMRDSLFNAPAFLTVNQWSKKAKAFLYSFDYVGKRNYGKTFLAGLPIADAQHASNAATTNHGDDLGYIFRRNTITGESIPDQEQNSEDEDNSITNAFTNLIADFARNGEVSVATQSDNGTWFPQLIPTFSDNTNSFISIASVPRVVENFRYCQMGLWTGLTERLQSSTCNLFKSTVETVNRVKDTAKQTIDVVKAPVEKIGSVTPKLGFNVPVVNEISNSDETEEDHANLPKVERNNQVLRRIPDLHMFPFGG